MKTFAIYITDKEGYGGECKVKAETKIEAMKQARQYIKAWGLNPATIDYCNEITQ